jgi:hypothetical protein
MDVLRTGVSVMGCVRPEPASHGEETARAIADLLLASLPSMLLYWHHYTCNRLRIDVETDDDSIAAHFLHLLHGKRPRPDWVAAMQTSLVLYAEHEFNASTFTARVIAGTGSDLYSCVTGAIGALKGPKHGGANEVALEIQERYNSPAEAEQTAHCMAFDLPHSDDCFVQAFPAETTEAFLEGHVHALEYFGAPCPHFPVGHDIGGGRGGDFLVTPLFPFGSSFSNPFFPPFSGRPRSRRGRRGGIFWLPPFCVRIPPFRSLPAYQELVSGGLTPSRTHLDNKQNKRFIVSPRLSVDHGSGVPVGVSLGIFSPTPKSRKMRTCRWNSPILPYVNPNPPRSLISWLTERVPTSSLTPLAPNCGAGSIATKTKKG